MCSYLSWVLSCSLFWQFKMLSIKTVEIMELLTDHCEIRWLDLVGFDPLVAWAPTISFYVAQLWSASPALPLAGTRTMLTISSALGREDLYLLQHVISSGAGKIDEIFLMYCGGQFRDLLQHEIYTVKGELFSGKQEFCECSMWRRRPPWAFLMWSCEVQNFIQKNLPFLLIMKTMNIQYRPPNANFPLGFWLQ